MRAGALLLAAALALSACASGEDDERPPPPPGGPGGQAVRPHAPNVFISPSGEPFRAAPDAPYASALWFRAADGDGDGRLSRAEFMADALRAFARFDANRDGVIDGFETNDYEQKIAPEILPRVGRLRAGDGQDPDLFADRGGGVRRTGPGGPGGRGGPERGGPRPSRVRAGDQTLAGAGPFAMLNEPEPLRAADSDLDGKITLAEWRARTERRFDLLDAKALGYLTLETLPKTAVQELIARAAKTATPPR